MLGINGTEFLLLLLVAVIVVGPARLPAYAEQLGRWVRTLRGFLGTAKERVASELGDEAADVDWASLDPRRYDPRRIVREALLEDLPTPPPPVDPGARTAPVYTTGAARREAAARTGSGAGATAAARPAARAVSATKARRTATGSTAVGGAAAGAGAVAGAATEDAPVAGEVLGDGVVATSPASVHDPAGAPDVGAPFDDEAT